MADGSTSSPQGETDNAIRQNARGPKQASADGLSADAAVQPDVRRPLSLAAGV
jgi:hypothetical protein